MKKPGMMLAIGVGPAKKGGSILGPGNEEESDMSADMGGDEEKKAYGKELLAAISAKDPMAIFSAIENIVACCGEGEEMMDEDD